MKEKEKQGFGVMRLPRPVMWLLLFCLLAGCASSGSNTGSNTGNSTSGNTVQDAGAAELTEQADTSGQEQSAEHAGTDDTAGAATSSGAAGYTGTAATSDMNSTEEETPASPPATLLYQGHASLRITTGNNKVIYIDPFVGEGYDLPADLILITHAHYDHNGTDKIGTRNAECTVITQDDALKDGTHQSFTFDDVVIEAVEAGYNANHDVKQCVGYVLTFADGIRLYVTGDTSTTPQMEALADQAIDYAFFCCDGLYNMDVAEASACAQTVGAKHSIPYHTCPADKALFDRDTAESFQADGRIILEPGDELKLE